MATVGIERRTEERYRLKTRVAITADGNRHERPHVCFTRNISSRGAFLEMDDSAHFACGHLLHLEIDLVKVDFRSAPVKFKTKGRVVRTEPAGLAIQFMGRANLVAG